MKGLLKTKTFWTSVGGICFAVGSHVAGETNLSTTILVVVGFVIAIFIRDAIVKA